MRPGDHAPFLETHTNSVRLGRSAYASDVGGHRHCGGKIHAKVADVGRRADVTSTYVDLRR